MFLEVSVLLLLKEMNKGVVSLSRYLGSKFRKSSENSRGRKYNKCVCLLGAQYVDQIREQKLTERNPGERKDYGRGQDRDKAVCYGDDLQFARAGTGNKVSSRSCRSNRKIEQN